MSNEYRIWRSFRSDFAGLLSNNANDLTDETVTATETYDDKELSSIAQSGFNAIWIHGILNNIVNVEPFPELGQNHLKHKAALRELIERTTRHGIKVFIYMQPPRAVSVSNTTFWDKHSDVGGQEEVRTDCNDDSAKVKVRALCTSTKPVQIWLKNAARQIAEELPGLGGIIMITASELPAHCYSGRQKNDPDWQIQCPNCKDRYPADIVVEIINLMRDGIRDVSDETAIIAWNWSWTMWHIPPPCHTIIDRLPKDVILMADFERGGYKDLWNRPHHFIDEYSLSYAGPSELCLSIFEAAKKRGMRTMSKLQLGTTHELASVVSLPLLINIFKKASYHKHSGIAGFMGCWNFGNHISTNTAAFNYFLSRDCPDDEENALKSFGVDYFPGCNIETLLQSWQQFDDAMLYYPFCMPFIYRGPMNYTLAYHEMYVPNKLTGASAGPSHLIVPRGDDLSDTYNYERGGHKEKDVFSLNEIIIRLKKLAVAWENASGSLEKALVGCSDTKAKLEIGNAAICGAIWRSTLNTFKIYKLRLNWNDSMLNEFMMIVKDELNILHKVLPYVELDPRQGYHAEAHGYMFNVQSIRNKIQILQKNYRDLKNRLRN